MPRFFVDREPEAACFLGGETGRHIVRSLRMRSGETLTLCAGTGKDFFCTVTEIAPDGAWVRVDAVRPTVSEPRTEVTVCMGWPKGDKLETVVQKSVELGARAIWPILTARCVARPDGASLEKKTARLRKIAREAAQQSGRGMVPEVLPCAPLETALDRAGRDGKILFFYENGSASLREALKIPADRLYIFVGPEGGFAPEEARLAEEKGAALLTLGPRILRTETAPIAALAAVLYDRGDFERRE